MKYFIFVLLLLFMTSCTSKSHLTLLSNGQINPSDFSVNTQDKGNYVSGIKRTHIICIVPTNFNPLFSDAYKEATKWKDTNMLVDVNLSQLVFYIPYIYGQSKLEITGYETK